MQESVIDILSQAEASGAFLSQDKLDRIAKLWSSSTRRYEIIGIISENAAHLVTVTAKKLFLTRPELIAPGGNACTTRRMAACLRDLELFLRYITYAMFIGDASVLEERCINGLKETYSSLNVPLVPAAKAIELMKFSTLDFLANEIGSRFEDHSEYLLSQIRKLYPNQWVCVKVTDHLNGLPSAGILLAHSSDLSTLSDYVKKRSDCVYTFFTGRIDSKPSALSNDRAGESRLFNSELLDSSQPGDQDLFKELAGYFNLFIQSLL